MCEDHFLEKDFVKHTRHRLNYEVIPKQLGLVIYRDPIPVSSQSNVGSDLKPRLVFVKIPLCMTEVKKIK